MPSNEIAKKCNFLESKHSEHYKKTGKACPDLRVRHNFPDIFKFYNYYVNFLQKRLC